MATKKTKAEDIEALQNMATMAQIGALEAQLKGGGGNLSRSVGVSLRLDPKLRYLADIAARSHRRTLSAYIEWAVQASLSQVSLRLQTNSHVSLEEVANTLWDVDEADRFFTLAHMFPDLLVHEEQILWKLICENGFFWKGRYDKDGNWVWDTKSNIVLPRLREHFDALKRHAAGHRETGAKLALLCRKKGTPTPDGVGDAENEPE